MPERSHIPRPGLALGDYPEQRRISPTGLDDLLNRTVHQAAMKWRLRAGRLSDVIARIQEYGSVLPQLSDDELQKKISILRSDMVYTGGTDNQVFEAFAIVQRVSERVTGKRHFESQLLGGWAMYQGLVAEMQTGEGKTLTAILPAVAAAFAGIPVHVITVNDYLAVRDAEQMRPIYEALGLTLGVVTEDLGFSARQCAYSCDVTYVTNKQVCFDYLRDRVELGSIKSTLQQKLERFSESNLKNRKLMLRGLCYAIVDEADSVLIDEARTPLILSRPVKLEDANLLGYRQALRIANDLIENRDYVLCEDNRTAILTAHGISYLEEYSVGSNPVWQAVRQPDELVQQAVVAEKLYLRDRDYVVRDKKVQIVDGNTGRIMADRSWGRGLQQMIEIKEQCSISNSNETLARISYQQFFRRYFRLSGMTGTAHAVKSELVKVYGMGVVPIQPHRAMRRVTMPEKIYACVEHAHAAVVSCALSESESRRPVLVGTRTVLQSEQLAKTLFNAGANVQVLNARQNVNEIDVITRAGTAGQITVATNMAGRGTDILLSKEVEEYGGLHVILTERNDAERIDRQLLGRSARQGSAGSYQVISSLDDDVPRKYLGKIAIFLLKFLANRKTQLIPGRVGCWVLDRAQARCERHYERSRRQVEREDERMKSLLSFSGKSD